jgi:hypothetical protein
VRFSGGSSADDDGPVEAMATLHSESVTMSCVDCPTGHQQSMRLDGPNFHNLRSHAFHKHLEPQQQRSRQGSITDLLNTQARQPPRSTCAAAAAAGCAEGGRNEMPPSKQQQQHKPKPSRKRPRRGDVSDADMVVALNRERERFLAGTRHSLSAIVAPGSASASVSASTATSHSPSHQTPPSLQQQQQQPFASSPVAGSGRFQFPDSRRHIISNADDDASHSAAAFVSGGPSCGDYSATRAVAKHVAQVAAAAAAAVRHVVVVDPASSSAPGWSISASGGNARRRGGRLNGNATQRVFSN